MYNQFEASKASTKSIQTSYIRQKQLFLFDLKI